MKKKKSQKRKQAEIGKKGSKATKRGKRGRRTGCEGHPALGKAGGKATRGTLPLPRDNDQTRSADAPESTFFSFFAFCFLTSSFFLPCRLVFSPLLHHHLLHWFSCPFLFRFRFLISFFLPFL